MTRYFYVHRCKVLFPDNLQPWTEFAGNPSHQSVIDDGYFEILHGLVQ